MKIPILAMLLGFMMQHGFGQIQLPSKRAIDNWSKGTEWIYEQEENIGGPASIISYKTITVTDTFTSNGRLKYLVSGIDTVYHDIGKTYVWDKDLNDYIMYFDFGNSSQYEVKYWDRFREVQNTATIVIDSISEVIFDNDTIGVQHVRVINSGTIENDWPMKIYEGIGTNQYDWKFILGCGLCDDNTSLNDLRCFSNGDIHYKFVPFSCDSSWIKTSVDVVQPLEYQIFPNPATNLISISQNNNSNVKYDILDAMGRYVQTILAESGSQMHHFDISHFAQGLYFIKISKDNEVHGVFRFEKI